MLKQLVIGLAIILATGIAQAQPKVGVDYRELGTAQPTESAGKIEVVEFFSYLCPHCYSFDSVLMPWVNKLPKDVQFRRIPAMFSDDYAKAARAFYALEAIGEEQRLHTALFDAVHTSAKLRVADEAELTAWLGKQGVDTKKFAAAYHSFGVETNLKRASQLSDGYKIDGVPAMAVNGKYVVLTDNIKSLGQVLTISDALIERSRKQSGNAAPKKK